MSQNLINNVISGIRCCVQCHGINSDTQVGLLFSHLIEAKECWTDLFATCLVLPALNVDVIWISVACLLLQMIQAKCLWLQSLRTCGQPLHCCQCMIMPSIRYTHVTLQIKDITWAHLASTIMPHSNSDNSCYLTVSLSQCSH